MSSSSSSSRTPSPLPAAAAAAPPSPSPPPTISTPFPPPPPLHPTHTRAPSLSHALTALLSHRQSQLSYLLSVHSSTSLHLNLALLSPTSVPLSLPPLQLRLRIHRYFLLSLSLGRLHSVHPPPTLLLALSTLLDEFAFHSSHHHPGDAYYHHSASDHTRHIHHTLHAPAPTPSTLHPTQGQGGPVKQGRYLLFSHLLVPPSLASHPAYPSSTAFSYPALVHSLIALLSSLYARLKDLPPTPPILALLTSVDRRLQSLLLQPLMADLTHATSVAIKGGLSGLKEVPDPRAGADGGGKGAEVAVGVGVKEEGGGGGLGGLDLKAITALTSVWNTTGTEGAVTSDASAATSTLHNE